jgi:death-on-curing protein
VTDTWPDAEHLLLLLGEHTGPQSRIRDAGILFSAAARPHAVMLGEPVYPTAIEKAAALLHGITCWRPLDFWNTGLAWGAAHAQLRRARLEFTMPAAEQMELTEELISGDLDDVNEVTSRLHPHVLPPR